MLKWKRLHKRFLPEHKWVLLFWGIFILISFIIALLTPYGFINIWLSENYNNDIGVFFKYFTYFGEEWLLIPISLIFVFIIRNHDFTIKLAFTFAINTIITVFFKFLIFNYNRPKLVLQKFNLVFTEGVLVHQYNSFPSGHTSAAFAFAVAFAFWFESKWMSFFLILMAVGVGISRLYLQQHFIEDVIGGATVGLISAILASRFYWIPKNLASSQLKTND